MDVYKNAVKFRAFNSGGKGGQHGNRSMNAIEASLCPTVARKLGIPALKATATTSKSQHQNRALAARILKVKIREALRSDKARYGAGAGRVRNYHEPDNRVTDSTGARWLYTEVMGKPSGFAAAIDERRRSMAEGN